MRRWRAAGRSTNEVQLAESDILLAAGRINEWGEDTLCACQHICRTENTKYFPIGKDGRYATPIDTYKQLCRLGLGTTDPYLRTLTHASSNTTTTKEKAMRRWRAAGQQYIEDLYTLFVQRTRLPYSRYLSHYANL